MTAYLLGEIYLLCLIVVALLLFWMLYSKFSSTSERWFRRTLLGFLLSFLSNFCFVLFNGIWNIEGLSRPLAYLFKTLFHILLCLAVFAWCGYAKSESKDRIGAKALWTLGGLIALPVLAALVNLKTHFLFSIDETGVCRRGWMDSVELGILFLAGAFCSLRLMKLAREETDLTQKGHLRLVAGFPLCFLAALLLSPVSGPIPVICVCVTLGLLCLFLGNTMQQISTDKLTQVNNRQNLLGYLDYKLKNHDEALYLLMMDVDSFKTINDSFGHLEGDKALVCVSAALKKACASCRRRPYIARYGGDEFIILLEGSEEEARRLAADVNRILAENNPGTDRYRLHLSVGLACGEQGMASGDLIARADEELYKIKKAAKPE